MKFAPKFVFVALWLVLATACDIQKTANQLTARSTVVATILATPNLTLKPQAIAGFDAGRFAFDAGFLADAGLPDVSDAGVPVPAQNMVSVFFGQREGDGLDLAPRGVSGATVALRETGGRSFSLNEAGGGSYVLNVGDAGFRYAANATYRIEIQHAGETYAAEVATVPAEERIAAFEVATGFVDVVAGQALTLMRAEPAPGQRLNLGFVSVFPIDLTGKQAPNPTYTNLPATPLQFLKLLGDTLGAQTEYRAVSVTIPGAAFPEPNRNYLILFQSAKTGGPVTENLFAGSAIIAGTAAVGVVKTR